MDYTMRISNKHEKYIVCGKNFVQKKGINLNICIFFRAFCCSRCRNTVRRENPNRSFRHADLEDESSTNSTAAIYMASIQLEDAASTV